MKRGFKLEGNLTSISRGLSEIALCTFPRKTAEKPSGGKGRPSAQTEKDEIGVGRKRLPADSSGTAEKKG